MICLCIQLQPSSSSSFNFCSSKDGYRPGSCARQVRLNLQPRIDAFSIDHHWDSGDSSTSNRGSWGQSDVQPTHIHVLLPFSESSFVFLWCGQVVPQQLTDMTSQFHGETVMALLKWQCLIDMALGCLLCYSHWTRSLRLIGAGDGDGVVWRLCSWLISPGFNANSDNFWQFPWKKYKYCTKAAVYRVIIVRWWYHMTPAHDRNEINSIML
jgi:hypothetical protein